MSWTEERIEILRADWAAGYSAGQIARKLGPGFTRNSVIGKVTRLKLPRRLDANGNRFSKAELFQGFTITGRRPFLVPADGKPKRSEPLEPYVARETIVTPEDKRVSFEALEPFDRKCRYAHGEAPPYTFCGAPTIAGTSWCAVHFEVVTGAPHPSQLSENLGEFEQPGISRELEDVS